MPTWFSQFLGPILFGFISFFLLRYCICLAAKVVKSTIAATLRHSHIAIRYPQAVERLLMSPAQHQLHHSQSEKHYDRNFGVALSVWDLMFGSFHHSVSETLSFGIGKETARFTGSIWSMYWLPVSSLARRITRTLFANTRQVASAIPRFLARNY